MQMASFPYTAANITVSIPLWRITPRIAQGKWTDPVPLGENSELHLKNWCSSANTCVFVRHWSAMKGSYFCLASLYFMNVTTQIDAIFPSLHCLIGKTYKVKWKNLHQISFSLYRSFSLAKSIRNRVYNRIDFSYLIQQVLLCSSLYSISVDNLDESLFIIDIHICVNISLLIELWFKYDNTDFQISQFFIIVFQISPWFATWKFQHPWIAMAEIS